MFLPFTVENAYIFRSDNVRALFDRISADDVFGRHRRQLLVIVKPETLIRWHHKGFQLFCRWRSRAPGRPAGPANLQRLIATMAAANRTWGEKRIAAELLLTLGIPLSSRTLRRYTCARDAAETQRGKRGSGGVLPSGIGVLAVFMTIASSA